MKIDFHWKCFVGSLWHSCFINCILNDFFKLAIRVELLNTENALPLFLWWIFWWIFWQFFFFWWIFLTNILMNFWRIICQFFDDFFYKFSDVFFDVFFDHFFDGILWPIFCPNFIQFYFTYNISTIAIFRIRVQGFPR